MDERIEVAATALFDSFYGGSSGLDDVAANIASQHARIVIAVAFPELTGPNPTHRIVPVEPSEAMRYAAWFAQAKYVGATDSEATELTKRRMTPEQRKMDVAAFKSMLAAAD